MTGELGALGDEAVAVGRVGENAAVGTMLGVAVVPRRAAGLVLEGDAAAAATAAETVADPVFAGGSAAAVGGGSTSHAAAPRAAQKEAEEPSPGVDQEQTAEAVLSASPAPVTAAVLAALVSAAAGEQGAAPSEVDVMPVAANAGTRVPAAAANRQGRGQAEGEFLGPANGASAGAARAGNRHLSERIGRHRPEAGAAPTNEEDAAGSEDNGGDPEFMCGDEAESEEVSLEEETGVDRNAPNTRGRGSRGDGQNQQAVGDTGGATDATDVFSPTDMAKDEAIWQEAGGWDMQQLQRSDQPFLVRRLPPQILDKYSLCLLAPLLRLEKFPSCLGTRGIPGFSHGGTHPTEAAEPANGLPPEPGDTAPLPRVGPTTT
ncbi:unnamed protein product [Closterium sp. NIES-65]|nr:unnamed protein product [Closterium sp. NIES-65]